MAQTVKNLPAMKVTRFHPWVGKIPWRRKWLPTPVFLPGEFFGQRSLAGYSPWGLKESDTTEQLTHTRKISTLSTTGIIMRNNVCALNNVKCLSREKQCPS